MQTITANIAATPLTTNTVISVRLRESRDYGVLHFVTISVAIQNLFILAQQFGCMR